MKVGIDVHSLGSGSGGNESYYRELLYALQQVNSEVRYFLYGVGPHVLEQRNERFQCKPVSGNRYIRIPFSLPRSARRDEIDIFHAQFIVPPGMRCRTVTTIPDIAFERFPEWFPLYQRTWSKYLVRSSAHIADHIITVSESSKFDLIDKYHVAPEKITVIYPAPARSFYPRNKRAAKARIAERYGIDGNFILYVGRLQGRKNLLRLVDAFAKVRRSSPQKLVLAGCRDTLFAPVEKLIKERKLDQFVLLPGYIVAEDLPWLYSAADLFVYPSLYEGFGLPVVEAMTCGVPVVTSKGSSLEEVAGGAALLCDPLDTDSIASCLEKAGAEESLRSRLSDAGLFRSRRFTHQAMAVNTIRVYEQVMGTTDALKNCSTSPLPKATVCH